MQVRLDGSGGWAPVWETAGMSARCLRSASCWCVPGSLRLECAGQGAHREVGSEGFEANCRAVAELTANRSARSRRYRACTMEAKEVLGEPGRNKVCAGGTAGKQHALPREISYGPGPTGPGTWAYKPQSRSGSRASIAARTTTSPSHSRSTSCSPACVPSYVRTAGAVGTTRRSRLRSAATRSGLGGRTTSARGKSSPASYRRSPRRS